MCHSVIYLILLFLNFNNFVSANKYNVSLSDLVQCKEYRIFENGYQRFFRIEDMKNDRVSNEILRFKFYVMTSKDAHILLSSTDRPTKSDDVYEIVIGAGGNTFSAIGQKISSGRLVIKHYKDILSSLDATPIVVSLSNDGRLDVNILGLPEPFMSYNSKILIPIKYISFRTYGQIPARWFYDCSNKENYNFITMENRNLTTLQQLQMDLFANYSVFTPPHDLREIKFSFKLNGVSFDRQRSIFKSQIEIKMFWLDTRIKWNPTDYNGLRGIKSSSYNFWTPSIMIINGADSSYQDFSPRYIGFIFYNGTLEVNSRDTIIETWCSEGSTNWPWDNLRCNVMLGLHGPQLKLIYSKDPSLTRSRILQPSEWQLSDIEVVNENLSNKNSEKNDLITTDLVLKFNMKRNQTYYTKLFYTPLMVAIILILSSITLSGHKRVIFNLTAFLILTLTLTILAKQIPVNHVPRLVHLYQAMIITSCIIFSIHIYSQWMKNFPPKTKPPKWIMTLINLSALRFIIGLKFQDATGFLSIQEYPWEETAKILNRLAFIGVILCFFIINIIGY